MTTAGAGLLIAAVLVALIVALIVVLQRDGTRHE